MEINTDYMLDLQNADLAVTEIKKHFIEEDLRKDNSLVHSMIKICARDYQVPEALIEKKLFEN